MTIDDLPERPFSFADEEFRLVLDASQVLPVERRKRFFDLVIDHMFACEGDVQAAITAALRSIVDENAANEDARRRWASRTR